MRNEHGQADGEGRGEKEKEEGRIVAQKCSGEIDYGLRPREGLRYSSRKRDYKMYHRRCLPRLYGVVSVATIETLMGCNNFDLGEFNSTMQRKNNSFRVIFIERYTI